MEQMLDSVPSSLKAIYFNMYRKRQAKLHRSRRGWKRVRVTYFSHIFQGLRFCFYLLCGGRPAAAGGAVRDAVKGAGAARQLPHGAPPRLKRPPRLPVPCQTINSCPHLELNDESSMATVWCWQDR